jgi:hypothetical protein
MRLETAGPQRSELSRIVRDMNSILTYNFSRDKSLLFSGLCFRTKEATCK